MSYLGRSAKLSLKAQEKVSFLATAGQTSKTGLSYTPSFIDVYVNGVLLTDTTDFTATNGNSITFTVALLLNDEVTVISLKTFTVADHYTKSDADTLRLGTQAFNRLSTDGTIVDLQKDSTVVGSIGVDSGDNLYITGGSGGTGGFYIDDTQILPATSGPTLVDNTLNLGRAATRFKDLHLSGGVYLGGTGAANKLDDYEEGTWTPVFTNIGTGTVNFHDTIYTKVGNLVTIKVDFDMTSLGTASGILQITGLPFSPLGSVSVGQPWTNGWVSNAQNISTWATSAILTFYIRGTSSVSSATHAHIGGGGNMYFNYTYFTNS